MIPPFPAFINEAIQVTGITPYFLHKSLFTILTTLAQHPFPDFFYLCRKMPQTATDDCAVSRCILLDCSAFAPWLLSLLSFGQKPHPDWCTGPVLLSTDSPHSHRPAASPWHRASPEWKSQCNLFLCSWFPFCASGPCREEDGSLASAPRSGSMLLREKGKCQWTKIFLTSLFWVLLGWTIWTKFCRAKIMKYYW